jgi:hypothetical protein
MSAVLLSHEGSADRETLYQELARVGFEQILSIEQRYINDSDDALDHERTNGNRTNRAGDAGRGDVESNPHLYDKPKPPVPNPAISRWAATYPFVRFILLDKPLPAGSPINLAAAELRGGCFLVLRKDCSLDPVKAETIITEAQNLCSVPLMFDRHKNALPIQPLAAFANGTLRTKLAVPAVGSRHLFPLAGIGVYNRELFIRLGGFDNSIQDEYWQLMDFGLRAYTWGERIRSIGTVKITRTAAPPAAPIIIGESYRRFYLKNLSPVYRADTAHLPLRRFPFFLVKSGVPLPDAWDEFAQARTWVRQNAYRWKCDVRTLLKNGDVS